jgi:hypothetical protein
MAEYTRYRDEYSENAPEDEKNAINGEIIVE